MVISSMHHTTSLPLCLAHWMLTHCELLGLNSRQQIVTVDWLLVAMAMYKLIVKHICEQTKK